MSENLVISGRIVQGSLSNPETKNREGQLLTNTDGSPRVRFYIGLAVPKNSPEWPAFLAQLQAAAQAGHPTAMNAPTFSWKWFDGDSVDSKGVPYSARDGMAGHYIINLSSGFAPECYSSLEGTSLQQIPADQVKRGYFVQVSWSTKANTSQTSPGVYVNLHMVRLIGYGTEIVSGPSAEEVFKDPAALPAGASAQPVAPTTPVAAATVTPNTAVMSPATSTPPPPPPPPPADIPTTGAPYVMSDAAKKAGLTYEALKLAKWSDEQMAAAGHILDFIPY